MKRALTAIPWCVLGMSVFTAQDNVRRGGQAAPHIEARVTPGGAIVRTMK